jgi:hypothetical protein
MGQSSSGKGFAVFAMRMGFLLLLVSSTLLIAGCASLSSDDRAVFYGGSVDPKSAPLIQ